MGVGTRLLESFSPDSVTWCVVALGPLWPRRELTGGDTVGVVGTWPLCTCPGPRAWSSCGLRRGYCEPSWPCAGRPRLLCSRHLHGLAAVAQLRAACGGLRCAQPWQQSRCVHVSPRGQKASSGPWGAGLSLGSRGAVARPPGAGGPCRAPSLGPAAPSPGAHPPPSCLRVRRPPWRQVGPRVRPPVRGHH